MFLKNKEAIRIANQNAVTAFNESIGAFVKSMEKKPKTFLENIWTLWCFFTIFLSLMI